MKFRPLNSESKLSIYSKSELCADNESKVEFGLFSERNELSFWLMEEMEIKGFRLVLIINGLFSQTGPNNQLCQLLKTMPNKL